MSEQSPSRKRGRDSTSQDAASGESTKFQTGGAGSASSSSAAQGAGHGVMRLRKGMVILKGFLSVQEQAELVAHVDRLGGLQHGGFYPCHNEKTKRMRMMNLGLKTDGKRHKLQIPRAWTELALRACHLAANTDPSIPVLRPDICVVNHYTAASRLGWHQDLFSARDPGLPVISFSLGQQATFQYRVSWKKTAATKTIQLASGDALVFGGRSRGIIHAVPGIDASDSVTASSAFRAGAAARAAGGGGGGVGLGEERGIPSLSPCVVPGGGRFNLNFREL
eukprot:g12841.t1